MSTNLDDSLATRVSLLLRLQDVADHSSWKEFYDRYRRFIFRAAQGKGLSQEDAEEVLQDTVISVAKGLPNFTYSPAGGSFKGWLMTITRRKVVDKLRKQGRQVPTTDLDGATVEKITADGCFEPAWEIEWHNNLLQAATDQLRLAVTPRSFQIFDWTVRMGRSTKETAEAFGISTVLVRVTKYRVLRKFKSILQRLEKEPWPKGCRP
jgi:RNA polymerase sigma-70 factor (ECF subfamily)